MLPSNKTYGFWLALFRIAVGAAWLVHAIPKFTAAGAFMPPDGYMVKIVAQSAQGSTGPYHDFLTNVVMPNIGLFAELTRFGEATVGVLLVLGLFTRLGGLLGVFIAGNYMVAQGETNAIAGIGGINAAYVLLSAANLVLPTGRCLGLDWFLKRRKVPAAVAFVPGPAAGPTVVAPDGTVQAEFVDETPLNGPSAPPG